MEYSYKDYKFTVKGYYNALGFPRFKLKVNNGDWKVFTSKILLNEYLEKAKEIIDRKGNCEKVETI